MTCHHEDYNHPISESIALNEMYYKELLRRSKIRILPTRDYTHLLKAVNLTEIKGNTMTFFVRSRYNGWHNYYQFPEWDEQVEDMSMTAPEAAQILLAGSNLKFHCDCPSFLFHGYEYILTQQDAAIVPENRFPHVRNPHLNGVLCKHGRKSATVLGFHLGDMARAIRNQRQERGLI